VVLHDEKRELQLDSIAALVSDRTGMRDTVFYKIVNE
jgi:hypothetical protein